MAKIEAHSSIWREILLVKFFLKSFPFLLFSSLYTLALLIQIRKNFEPNSFQISKSYFFFTCCSTGWISVHQSYILYTRHYNPLLIRNRSRILTIHKARILRKKPLEKTFLDFKKWVKSKQTAGYNGACTVHGSENSLYISLSVLFPETPNSLMTALNLDFLFCPSDKDKKICFQFQ